MNNPTPLLRCCAITAALFLTGISFSPSSSNLVNARTTPLNLHNNGGPYTTARKVPFNVYIESRCPDARDCLQKLVVPAYEQVADKVDFQIGYVGEVWTAPRRNVTCQHGFNECEGNRFLACANEYADSVADALDFNNCVLSSYERVPESKLLEECARDSDIDYGKIHECAYAKEGLDLLYNSVEDTISAGANFSCTVQVDKELWCVRDDYEWQCGPEHYEVGELVKYIKKLSRKAERGGDL